MNRNLSNHIEYHRILKTIAICFALFSKNIVNKLLALQYDNVINTNTMFVYDSFYSTDWLFILVGSAIFGATFNLVTRVRLP